MEIEKSNNLILISKEGERVDISSELLKFASGLVAYNPHEEIKFDDVITS